MMRRIHATMAAGMIGFSALVTVATAELVIHPIALTGEPAAETPPGVLYAGDMDSAVINEDSRVAFWSLLIGPGTSGYGSAGVWLGSTEDVELVARGFQPVPEMGAGAYIYKIDPGISLSDSNVVAFQSRIEGPGLGPGGIPAAWLADTGTVSIAVRRGQVAPGAEPRVFGTPFSNSSFYITGPSVNTQGQFAFASTLEGAGITTAENGVWTGTLQNLHLIVRTGDVAPAPVAGAEFEAIESVPQLNELGKVVFQARLNAGGTSIWVKNSESLSLVAKIGDPAADLPAGHTYGFLYHSRPTINDVGMVAFTGTIQGPSVESGYDGVLWAGEPGDLHVVARDGEAAVGGGPNARWRHIANGVAVLNNAGDVGFVACACGDDVRYGIWLVRADGSSRLIAIRGQIAPGAGGVAFGEIQRAPTLNARGQAAFLSGLASSGASDEGIWATDRSGALQLVARRGQDLEVAPDDVRIVEAVRLVLNGGGGNGLGSSLNDRGELAFSAKFTNGSQGVFVTSLGPAGDVNGDGIVDVDDAAAFALLLVDPQAYRTQFPFGSPLDGDLNGDGAVDGADVQLFVALLT